MSNNNCVFCRIIVQELPVSLIHEDELTIAFMTLEQPTGYKVIVVTKEHIATVFDLTDTTAAAIMLTTVRVARAVRQASNCDGLNLYQANGESARQDVFHFHMHIIPRYKGDSILFDWDITPSHCDDLNKMAKEIRQHLS
jgi:histidine triad (HIT) family protein